MTTAVSSDASGDVDDDALRPGRPSEGLFEAIGWSIERYVEAPWLAGMFLIAGAIAGVVDAFVGLIAGGAAFVLLSLLAAAIGYEFVEDRTLGETRPAKDVIADGFRRIPYLLASGVLISVVVIAAVFVTGQLHDLIRPEVPVSLNLFYTVVHWLVFGAAIAYLLLRGLVAMTAPAFYEGSFDEGLRSGWETSGRATGLSTGITAAVGLVMVPILLLRFGDLSVAVRVAVMAGGGLILGIGLLAYSGAYLDMRPV